jgi:uncharacterized membrane protein YuzA (DUF378 family)
MSAPSSAPAAAASSNYTKMITLISTVIASVGAINWGSQAMGCNLVECVASKSVSRIIYIIVGIAGLIALILAFKNYNAEEYYDNPTYSGSSNPLYADSTSSVSVGGGAYASLA